MLPYTYLEESTVIGAPHYQPSISIIVPFHPVMSAKSELEQRIKTLVEKIEKELLARYPIEKALPVIGKLFNIVRNLNYNTHKKSIAIFVSMAVEKVYYLDIAVEEKVVLDDSFEIRDLVYSKKQNTKFLVLILSAERSMLYLGDCSRLTLIKSNVPDHIADYRRDLPERVSNFSDPVKRKEILLDKFLQQMDEGLSIMLGAYNVPVFVIGTEKVLGHFTSLTRNAEKLIGFIHGNYNDATEAQLRQLLEPQLQNWSGLKQRSLLQELAMAKNKNKLVWGIEGVWKAANNNNSRLLVVERSFIYPSQDKPTGEKSVGIPSESFYIKDVVDDIIEKVLQNGGDAEFVDNGTMQEYDRIAMIRYY